MIFARHVGASRARAIRRICADNVPALGCSIRAARYLGGVAGEFVSLFHCFMVLDCGVSKLTLQIQDTMLPNHGESARMQQVCPLLLVIVLHRRFMLCLCRCFFVFFGEYTCTKHLLVSCVPRTRTRCVRFENLCCWHCGNESAYLRLVLLN